MIKLNKKLALASILAMGSTIAVAQPAADRSICLSSGPIETIGLSNFEGTAGEPGSSVDLPLELGFRFYTLSFLNASRIPLNFEARFFQLDGPGSFEVPDGPWGGYNPNYPGTQVPPTQLINKAKVEVSKGLREAVPASTLAMLNTDIADDVLHGAVYALEAQVKVSGRRVQRHSFQLTGHARSGEDMRIVPEHRLINNEWTEIPCTW